MSANENQWRAKGDMGRAFNALESALEAAFLEGFGKGKAER